MQKDVFLSSLSKNPYCQLRNPGEVYPLVTSTMKKMIPNEARAVSAVTSLQKLNGKRLFAVPEHEFIVPPVCIQFIHSTKASLEFGR